MKRSELHKEAPTRGEELPRWLTFGAFWGVISYLLACVSLIIGSRSHIVRLSPQTLGLGLLMHVATFTAGGSLAVAAGSAARGKSSIELSQEEISGGKLERTVVQWGVGGALGSVLPFGLAVGSMELAGKLTGVPAFERREVNWPTAVGTMVASSGVTSLAVSRIAAWVAPDAKS